MQQQQEEKRLYILEHENMIQHHTMKLFKNFKPSERIPQQTTFIPPTVPRRCNQLGCNQKLLTLEL